MREGQLAAAEHASQHAPAATRLIEMEHVGELVSDEQFDRIVGVEQLTLDRGVRERDDPVRGRRRRRPVEYIPLIDDDQADLASWSRPIRARQQRMRRFGPGRGAPRVVFQADLEGHDEVRRLECSVGRERNTELCARIGRNQKGDDTPEDRGACPEESHVHTDVRRNPGSDGCSWMLSTTVAPVIRREWNHATAFRRRKSLRPPVMALSKERDQAVVVEPPLVNFVPAIKEALACTGRGRQHGLEADEHGNRVVGLKERPGEHANFEAGYRLKRLGDAVAAATERRPRKRCRLRAHLPRDVFGEMDDHGLNVAVPNGLVE